MAETNPRPSPGGQRARPASPDRRFPGRGVRPNARGPGAPANADGEPASRRGWRDIPAPIRWAGAIVLLLVAAVAIFLAMFQWNWLRGPIDSYASRKLQRQVVIHGDLSAHVWTWTPSLTGRSVTVAQPAWAGAGQMATLPSLTLGVDLKALLGGKLVMSVVDAERPDVVLRRDATGRDNWTFGIPQATPAPLTLPPIRHFTIAGGHVSVDDAERHLRFTGQVSSNEEVTGYGRGRFDLNGKGTLNGNAFVAQIEGGPLINVDPDKPYPFQSDIHAGATHVVAQGTIPRPFDLGVFQATGRITGEDLADLYDITGVATPNSPPYDLAGHLSRNGDRVDITGIHGRVGSSDLAGHLTVLRKDGRRAVNGDLSSRNLKLADLTPVIGGAPRGALRGAVASAKQEVVAAQLTAEHRILPDARLDVSRIRQTDADIHYRADSVDAGSLPIRQLALHAKLDRGLLVIDPLALSLPQGALSGHIRLDARGASPATTVDLALANAQVQELMPKAKSGGMAPLQGSLEARARLSGVGDSVRAAAGSANGVVDIAIPQGQMRQLFAELLGIDIGRSLFLYLSKDQTPTPVRCAVAEFQARDGILTAQRLMIDTGAVRAEGGGTVNLKDETLNLELSGKPKHFRLLRIAAPITMKGRLDDPKLGVDVGKALPQLGAAALLGAFVSPLAVALPFIAGGQAKDADCGALLTEAATHGAPVSRTAVVAAKH